MSKEKAKAVNYTDEQVQTMKDRYEAAKTFEERNEVVAALAEELGKTPRSIRSKLVNEGVYIKAETVSKVTGEPAAKKEALAVDLVNLIGPNEKGALLDADSVAKMNKLEIAGITKHIADLNAKLMQFEQAEFEEEFEEMQADELEDMEADISDENVSSVM